MKERVEKVALRELSAAGAIAKTLRSNTVGDCQDLCGTLANDNAWRHDVAGRHAGHDGGVRDPEILESKHSGSLSTTDIASRPIAAVPLWCQ